MAVIVLFLVCCGNTLYTYAVSYTHLDVYKRQVCACLMVALSAQAYQQLQKNRQNDLNTMNVFSYINNKLRENDVEKGVTVLNIDQCSVLKLTSVEGYFETATYIYSKDGMLYEKMCIRDRP